MYRRPRSTHPHPLRLFSVRAFFARVVLQARTGYALPPHGLFCLRGYLASPYVSRTIRFLF